MIIDANVHITEDGKWFGTTKNASIKSLLEEIKKNKIDKALLLPVPGTVRNNYVLKIASQFPDKFIPAASFNPALYSSPENALMAFVQEFSNSQAQQCICIAFCCGNMRHFL